MDYSEGTALYHYQWDLVHNPPLLAGLGDGDEDGASIEDNRITSITFTGSEEISNVAAPHWEASALDVLKPVC